MDACGWCCRQQASRASVWFMVSKISPAAASAPLGFQPFIPGQKKRPVWHGTIGVVASIGRGIYCLNILLDFLIAKSSPCKHSVAVRQVLWLWGLSVCDPSFGSTPWFDAGARNASESIGFDHQSSEILPHCYTIQSLLHVSLCQMLNLAKFRRWGNNCTLETPSHYIETV